MGQQKAPADGAAAAAVLASGIGSLTLGLLHTVEHIFTPISEALNFYDPVGAHSGVAAVGVMVWLVAWAVLHRRWQHRTMNSSVVLRATLILIALALLGTFPPFYRALGGS